MTRADELRSHVTSLAFLEDPSGELTLEQVRSREWTPFSGVLSLGYSASAHWIRVAIVPGKGAATDKLVVRIRPAYLDQIRLYDPELQPGVVRVTGDRYPMSDDAYPSLYFNFTIARGSAPRDIWLRLKTTSTSQIHVDVLGWHPAIKQERSHELIFMLYLAAILLFLGWGLVNWLAERERLMGVFVLKQFIGLVYSFAYLGYLRVLWPDFLWGWVTPDSVTSLMVVTMVGAAYLFDYSFLKEFRAPRSLLVILRGVVMLCPLLIVLDLFGLVREVLQFNNMLVVISPLLTFVTALSLPATASRTDNDRLLVPKRFVVTLYLLVLISVSVSSLPASGLFKGTEWAFSGFLMYSLCTGAFFMVMLQIRATRLRQLRARLAVALESAEQRAEVEQMRRREQGSFLAMLAHELKTPLSVIQMVLSAPSQTPDMLSRARTSVGSMEEVIDRCLQVNRLEDARIAPQLESCNLSNELHEMVNDSGAGERIQLEIREPWRIHTDVTLLRIIVANLIDNALKYGDSAFPVRVEAGKFDQQGMPGIRIEVVNAPGKAGWPDPDLVFSKFYRNSRARNASGSGLGLFLVQGLASLLGGRVDYLPVNDEIRFRLWIPLH
ncbi:MAG: sensor histidine kinase [Alcanivorax sp.]|nr:sensor histidine kinase [Alcanivorax sp.]